MEGCFGFICLCLAFLIIAGSIFFYTPYGRAVINNWNYQVQKVDDATRYETRKQVEDTCRATIVSYESDKLIWEQYKDSESAEQRGWAESAKIRANKAAMTYNEYFLKNSYVFEGNIPADIRYRLEILK